MTGVRDVVRRSPLSTDVYEKVGAHRRMRPTPRKVEAFMSSGMPIRIDLGGADVVYSSHFFEHLTIEQGRSMLRESMRVLWRGGTFSICVPKARLHLVAYLGCVRSRRRVSSGLRPSTAPPQLSRPTTWPTWAATTSRCSTRTTSRTCFVPPGWLMGGPVLSTRKARGRSVTSSRSMPWASRQAD